MNAWNKRIAPILCLATIPLTASLLSIRRVLCHWLVVHLVVPFGLAATAMLRHPMLSARRAASAHLHLHGAAAASASASAAASSSSSIAAAAASAALPVSLSSSSFGLSSIRRISPIGSRSFASSSSSSSAPIPPPQPLRGPKHESEWALLRNMPNPRITTVNPTKPLTQLRPNDAELAALSSKYGLPPLPTLEEREARYRIEQAYYDRRDARIRAHLDRLLRMPKLSKNEMLILIDQVESSRWNLKELARAYIPETSHAEKEEREDARKMMRSGSGAAAFLAEYKARQEAKREKKEAAKAAGEPRKRKPAKPGEIPNDGEAKYGYRSDLVNFGPEFWDYLSPYMIVEPEARHLSYLDGAFHYEDRYVLWEEEQRRVSLAAKLQRMKILGIPLDHADTLPTPETLPMDHIYPNMRIRRRLNKLYAKGQKPDAAFWEEVAKSRRGDQGQGGKGIKKKEQRMMIEARKHLPEYIDRFETPSTAVEVNVGASTVLAQNLYIKQRIDLESKKPSLLTAKQQTHARTLLAVFAQRNQLAMKRMFLDTRTQWESLMLERALEKKYLEYYSTVGSEQFSARLMTEVEQEVMATMKEMDYKLRTVRRVNALQFMEEKWKNQYDDQDYAEEYTKKMEQLMKEHGEHPIEIQRAELENASPEQKAEAERLIKEREDMYAKTKGSGTPVTQTLPAIPLSNDAQRQLGQRQWLREMMDWEETERRKANKGENDTRASELDAELAREIETWNEWYDVQVARELGDMIDCGEIPNSEEVAEGSIKLAEIRVSKRLNATRSEWLEWKYRPQYVKTEDMEAPLDVKRVEVDEKADEGEREESLGRKIVKEILSKDPKAAASAEWKKRMAPKLAAVGHLEQEAVAGTLVAGVDSNGEVISSMSGIVSVDENGESYDTSVSSAGHRVLSMDDAADRRAMLEHARDTEQYIVHESADPLLKLLEEHTRNNVDGRRVSTMTEGAANGEEDESEEDPHRFSAVDPKLGFADDDFRLYDPVLTKMDASGTSTDQQQKQKAQRSLFQGGDGDEDTDITKADEELKKETKRTGMNPFEDELDDPMEWARTADRERRQAKFLDLDPFGPENTDERRAFDDAYLHLDEEEYELKRRVDPNSEHERPLTMQYLNPNEEYVTMPKVLQYDLSDETTELLYMLHRSNPAKYTPRALAAKFKLSAKRVKSHLVMQAIHYRMMENGIHHPLMFDYDEERAMNELLNPKMNMIHDPPELPSAPLPDYRFVREDDIHRVLAEQQQVDDRFMSRSARLDKQEALYHAKYGAIGAEPSAPHKPKLLDDRLMPPQRCNIMMVDISELPAARYAIAVRDKRGVLREPTHEEYNYVRKQEKGRHQFTYIKYHKEEAPM